MKDKFFLDTNIFVYSFDVSPKRTRALELIRAAHTGNGCISYQVVQEFVNVAMNKFERPFHINDLQIYLSKVLFPVCEIYSSEKLCLDALDITERWKYSYYDALIIASALEANCTILYSEDLHNSQKIKGLTIINPFL